VTSNSAIEQSGWFSHVVRTKVGSPFVVAAMEKAPRGVVGFEANGGTLVGQGISIDGEPLAPLPTRDAVLPLLCALGLAARQGQSVAALLATLPLRQALADRLPHIPAASSAAFLERLETDRDFAAGVLAPEVIAGLSSVDGPRFRTAAGEIVHFRASQNAPELRCFVEAGTLERARALLACAMAAASRALS
jgi:phosphomannomutase